jgi:putative FmdB family regulatory protein
MPLYLYKCNKCDHLVEKFRNKSEMDDELLCEECSGVCERQFSVVGNRVWLDAKDLYNQKIKTDAENIMKKIKSGKDKDFFDIYGDK